jgi:chromosome segregation ATPase
MGFWDGVKKWLGGTPEPVDTSANDQELSDLRGENLVLKGRVMALERQVESSENVTKALTVDLEVASGKIADANAALSEAESELSDLQGRLKRADQVVKDKVNAIANLNDEVAKMKEAVAYFEKAQVVTVGPDGSVN